MIRACKRRLDVFLFLLLTLVASADESYAQEPQRPLTVEDLFQLYEVDANTAGIPFAFSPDGKWLAYVLIRPKSTASELDFLGGLNRGDIWLVETRGGEPRNITSGATDGSGYWWPVWSPDSKRLAMYSTKGGGNVRLWVWERATGQLKQMSEREIDSRTLGTLPTWVSDHQLLFSVLPEGKKYRPRTIEIRAAEAAMKEWPKAWKGQEVTASVLESGVPLSYEPKGQLLLADLGRESRQVIVSDDYRGISPSPDKQQLAFFKQVAMSDSNDKGSQLVIISLRGAQKLVSPVVENFTDPRAKWSPDGKELALFENKYPALFEERRRDQPKRIYRYRIADRSLTLVISDDAKTAGERLRPADAIWSTKGDLIVQAEKKDVNPGIVGRQRADWWLVESPDRYRNLTATMKSVPTQLLRETDGESFIGISNGDLWRISTDSTPSINLTEKFEPKVESVVWPVVWLQLDEHIGAAPIIIKASRGIDKEYHKANLSSGAITALVKPTAKAEFLAFSAEKNMAVFGAHTGEGSYLWLTSDELAKPLTIVEMNLFLKGIAEGQIKRIEYRGVDGQDLKGWIILPINYEEGKRYAMVTWVYAGNMYGEEPPRLANLNYVSARNLQLLAARGYAVLIPSMPLKPEGEASDPYMELTKGVLPAIDRAVELGIADTNRVAVMGQSFGGYSTYGLITQTNRFKAAVAIAGPSDLSSYYGTFDARSRYDDEITKDNSFNFFLRTITSEGGWGRMGSPPWKDMGRYLRNSPLSYVDRVGTPVMIIQGDMDFVPIQQGEQFFTAMHRQGKRAEFVRYWGEGHSLSSPANIRDMWLRVSAWLDEFLDISRDQRGSLLWDKEKLRSRGGSQPLKPEAFARFDQIKLKESQSKPQSAHKFQ